MIRIRMGTTERYSNLMQEELSMRTKVSLISQIPQSEGEPRILLLKNHLKRPQAESERRWERAQGLNPLDMSQLRNHCQQGKAFREITLNQNPELTQALEEGLALHQISEEEQFLALEEEDMLVAPYQKELRSSPQAP